jgi:hypothetical protein
MSGPGGDGTEEAPERSTYNQPEGHIVFAFLQLPVNVSKGEPRTDFASGYDWADIHDKRGEGLSLAWPRISHTNNAAPQHTSRYSTHTRISLPCRPYAPESSTRFYIALFFFFFFFFFESISVRLRYRTIRSTLSIVASLLH